MNREDIIRMAREAGAGAGAYYDADFCFGEPELMEFACLIAEDCAKRCEAVASLHEGHQEYERSYGADTAAIAIREAYKP